MRRQGRGGNLMMVAMVQEQPMGGSQPSDGSWAHPTEAYIPDELDLLEPDFVDLDSDEHGPWVDAAPFRAHVRRLIAQYRLTWRTVAMLAEVPTGAIGRLVCGRGRRPVTRLHPLIAERLFHLTDEAVRLAEIRPASAARSRELLDRLIEHGWPIPVLADRAQIPAIELSAISSGERQHCSQLTEAVIKAVVQALWTAVGPYVPDQPCPRPDRPGRTVGPSLATAA
jgi:hypothetical protein